MSKRAQASAHRTQRDVEMEQVCLTCTLPECIDRRQGCPYQEKYGNTRPITLIQETCGVKENAR